PWRMNARPRTRPFFGLFPWKILFFGTGTVNRSFKLKATLRRRIGFGEVVDRRNGPKPLGRSFRRDVALRAAEELEADHEFADGRRAEERRVEMCVEMPFRMGRAVGRALMKTHRIGEGCLEDVVVADGKAAQRFGKGVRLGGGQLVKAADVTAGKHHY